MRLILRYKTLIVFLCILGFSLYTNLNYASTFVITSDAALEYNTYLYYTQTSWWQPQQDNLLASCLFTTYFPAIIQKVFDTDLVATYTTTMAVLVSLVPAVFFLAVRRFTSLLVAIGLCIFLMHSYYFVGSIMYARNNIAIFPVIMIVLAIIYPSRWRLLLFVGGGLLLPLTHYGSAFQMIVVLGVSALVYFILNHGRIIVERKYALIIAGVLIFAVLWLSVINDTPLRYAISTIIGIRTLENAPRLLLETRDMLIYRLLIDAVMGFVLFRKRNFPALALLIGADITVGIAAAVPRLTEYYGILRAMHVTMPISLLACASVVGKIRWQYGGMIILVILYYVYCINALGLLNFIPALLVLMPYIISRYRSHRQGKS